MQKPINISIDTKNPISKCLYENIRKGDTLLMTVKIFQDSSSLNLSGQSMHIVLKKSDGYAVEKIINSVTGNYFQVAFSVQATLAIGDVEGIVEISDSNGTNITNTFTFKVLENPASTVVENSKNEIETLQQIKALIDSYNANADNLAIQNQLALQHEVNLSTLNTNADNLAERLEKDISDGIPLAERLEKDNTDGLIIANRVELDISNANLAENKLQAATVNGNNVITQLQNVNWKTMQSWMDLMEFISVGMPFTDENSVEFTDENNVVFTM